MSSGRTRLPWSISPPRITIPTRSARKNALKTQPYSSIPPSSRATIGMAVETASDSNATRVIVRISPIDRPRSGGEKRPPAWRAGIGDDRLPGDRDDGVIARAGRHRVSHRARADRLPRVGRRRPG